MHSKEIPSEKLAEKQLAMSSSDRKHNMLDEGGTSLTLLYDEWQLLQVQIDSYEKCSLLIKVFNLALVAASLIMDASNLLILIVAFAAWLLDGMWKTFQSRFEQRILLLEDAIAKQQPIHVFQLHTTFLKNRVSTVGLINEYIKQSIRPTMAIIHVTAVVVLAIQFLNG